MSRRRPREREREVMYGDRQKMRDDAEARAVKAVTSWEMEAKR